MSDLESISTIDFSTNQKSDLSAAVVNSDSTGVIPPLIAELSSQWVVFDEPPTPQFDTPSNDLPTHLSSAAINRAREHTLYRDNFPLLVELV